MKEIAYTDRSLIYINDTFRTQSTPHNNEYSIHEDVISANFPFCELNDFKSLVMENIVNGKNIAEFKKLLMPLFKTSIQNVKLYNRYVKKIYHAHRISKTNTYKSLPIGKSINMSIYIKIENSRELEGHTDPKHVFYGLDKKEYSVNDYYVYSREVNTFLKKVVFNDSAGNKILNGIGNSIVFILKTILSRSTAS